MPSDSPESRVVTVDTCYSVTLPYAMWGHLPVVYPSGLSPVPAALAFFASLRWHPDPCLPPLLVPPRCPWPSPAEVRVSSPGLPWKKPVWTAETRRLFPTVMEAEPAVSGAAGLVFRPLSGLRVAVFSLCLCPGLPPCVSVLISSFYGDTSLQGPP